MKRPDIDLMKIKARQIGRLGRADADELTQYVEFLEQGLREVRDCASPGIYPSRPIVLDAVVDSGSNLETILQSDWIKK